VTNCDPPSVRICIQYKDKFEIYDVYIIININELLKLIPIHFRPENLVNLSTFFQIGELLHIL